MKPHPIKTLTRWSCDVIVAVALAVLALVTLTVIAAMETAGGYFVAGATPFPTGTPPPAQTPANDSQAAYVLRHPSRFVIPFDTATCTGTLANN